MSNIDAINQKIKGKLQKAKGTIEQNISDDDDVTVKVKGGISKLKGSVNDTIGGMRLESKQKKKQTYKAM